MDPAALACSLILEAFPCGVLRHFKLRCLEELLQEIHRLLNLLHVAHFLLDCGRAALHFLLDLVPLLHMLKLLILLPQGRYVPELVSEFLLGLFSAAIFLILVLLVRRELTAALED